MATITECLLRLSLALAFVLGLTARLMPPSVASAEMSVSTDMASGCDDPQPPCTGNIPNCLHHGGCITVSGLPASSGSVVVPVEWTSLGYSFVRQALAGISVKPELLPPILAA
jgi:hypothetical protein